MDNSSCFICLTHVVNEHTTTNIPRRGRPPKKKFENNVLLKELLVCLSKLLCAPSSVEADWNFLSELNREQEICCKKCYELLKDVERVYQVLLTTRRLLGKYLDHVGRLIVRSEERSKRVYSSHWSSSCFQLRKSILDKRIQTSDNLIGVHVKKEQEIEIDVDVSAILRDTCENWDNNVLDNGQSNDREEPWSATPDNLSNSTPLAEREEPDENDIIAAVLKLESAEKDTAVDMAVNESCDIQTTGFNSSYLDDKREKLFKPNCRGTPSRSAKKNAQQALKQYILPDYTTDNNDQSGDDDPIWEGELVGENDEYDDAEQINAISSPLSESHPCSEDEVGDASCEGTSSENKNGSEKQATTHARINSNSGQSIPNKEKKKKWICDFPNCGKKFTFKSTFNQHNKKVHNRLSPKQQQMVEIRKQQSKSTWPENQISATYDKTTKEYVCDFPNCARRFSFRSNFNRHKRIHVPTEQRSDRTQCPECGIELFKDKLKKHLASAHFPERVDKFLQCEYCDKRFLTAHNSFFQAHVRRHRGEKPFVCEECGASFSGRASLKCHTYNVHENKDDDPTPCDVCGKVYGNKRKLRVHLVRKHRDQANVGPVRKNASKFYRSQDKQVEKPLDKRRFLCDFEGCDYGTDVPKTLRRHKQTHLALEDRTDQAVCPECGKHLMKYHLAAHMMSMHTDPETVKDVLTCPICDKRFLPRNKSALEAHIRRHRGEKPFLCTECGKSYADYGVLYQHMKSVHNNNEDPIPCEYCDKVYTKKGSLERHMERRHPENYPREQSTRKLSKFYYNEEEEEKKKKEFIGPLQKFPCPVCETVYAYRFTMRNHLLKIHGIELDKM